MPESTGLACGGYNRDMTTRLTVTGTTRTTPSLTRVSFRSDDLTAFAGSEDTDRYVKLVFPVPGQDLPVVRTYTALDPDVEAGTLAIEFVVHGDSGVAGPWAAQAHPGDELEARGPGGSYRPDLTADWHLLVGDEAAVPAIRAALEALPPGATAQVLVQVDSRDHEPALPAAAGVSITFVHRPGDLVEAVRSLSWLPGRVHAFVHGEAGEVMHAIRPYLLAERGLTRDQVSISGYWRRGRTEEGFREWKSELARSEG
ncbi:MAG: siderophore utilization protein [Marmoricola sp.]|nr:siderophore utilization protein [Marmoricola sp.]